MPTTVLDQATSAVPAPGVAGPASGLSEIASALAELADLSDRIRSAVAVLPGSLLAELERLDVSISAEAAITGYRRAHDAVAGNTDEVLAIVEAHYWLHRAEELAPYLNGALRQAATALAPSRGA